MPEGAGRDAFVEWLGGLNRANASLSWWAYTSTAKNLLSSPLGDAYFAQSKGTPPAAPAALEPLARLLWQFVRMAALWCTGALRAPAGPAPQAVIFTYVDGSFRGGPDAFFGTLARELPVRARHVAFIHGAYRAALRPLAAQGYEPLFGSLRLADLLWCLKVALAAWWRAGRHDSALLRQALRWDLGRGGYYYNLLVHCAALRLFAHWRPQWLIYPYENKALEKMLLLAVRAASPATRIVGYQHSAVTRRHTTLLFAAGEAESTPLPDRIVTVGEVTRRFLEAHGRYPEGIFATGCALRQPRAAPFGRRTGGGAVRLLLALSSSRQELISAVALCRRALQADRGIELALRPHPEFPLRLLPAEMRAWTSEAARDFSGTPLAENLEWCDAVVYVSSTVALEALGRGRPVIALALGEAVDPDPILEPLELRWHAASPAALAAAAREIASLDEAQFERRQRAALAYVERYLVAPTPQALAAFLPT